MLFEYDIMFIDHTQRSKQQTRNMERGPRAMGFKLNRSKTESVQCTFNDEGDDLDVQMKIDTQVVPKNDGLKYLGSMIHGNGEIDFDITRCIRQTSRNGIIHQESYVTRRCP